MMARISSQTKQFFPFYKADPFSEDMQNFGGVVSPEDVLHPFKKESKALQTHANNTHNTVSMCLVYLVGFKIGTTAAKLKWHR